jgi:hypothetical protein
MHSGVSPNAGQGQGSAASGPFTVPKGVPCGTMVRLSAVRGCSMPAEQSSSACWSHICRPKATVRWEVEDSGRRRTVIPAGRRRVLARAPEWLSRCPECSPQAWRSWTSYRHDEPSKGGSDCRPGDCPCGNYRRSYASDSNSNWAISRCPFRGQLNTVLLFHLTPEPAVVLGCRGRILVELPVPNS